MCLSCSSSEDVTEPASQTIDRSSTSEEDDEGSIVDMLLADVRSGFATRKFNDGNFSVTKVTKVNLSGADLAKALSSGTGDVVGSEAPFARGGSGRSSQRKKRQDGSLVDTPSDDGSSPTPDSVAQRRNRRSYVTEDDNSLIDFLMDAEDSQNSEPQRPETNFERYASLRRRRQERKDKRHGLDLIDQERERAPSPSVTDPTDPAGVQMRLQDGSQGSPNGNRPKSQNEAEVKGSRSLRRTRSWLDRPSVEKANQEVAETDSSDALISRIKQRLGRKDGGRSTPPPPIPEEVTRTPQRSSSVSPSPSSRWRTGIPVGNDAAGSPLDPITEKSPTLDDFSSSAVDRTRDRATNRFRSSLDPAEVNRALQDFDDTDSSATRSKDDSDVSSPSVMVSVRKQISSGMGTNIDHILKTIEDTGRQIDTVGVSGPMQRTPEPSLKSSAAPKPTPVAVVAHVTAQNRPITPINELELKKKRDMRKKRSTLSMEDVKAAMKLGDTVSNVEEDSNKNTKDLSNVKNVSTSKTPPTPRRHSSSSEKSDGEGTPGKGGGHVSSKEMSKAAKLAAKKKFRDARFGAPAASESNNPDRAKSNVESETVDQALKEMATKGSMSRSKSYDEHVSKKSQDGEGEDFESNTIMRNSGSAPDTSKERKAVMRKSNSRLSMDGRRNGLYIPSDESDTELKPEDLGNRRSSKSDSPKSFSRLSLKSTNTSTETLQNDVESSPEQKRKSSSSSQPRQHLSRDDTYANASVISAAQGSPNSLIPTLPQRPTSACAMDAGSLPLRRTYSLMDRSKVFDEESDSPLAAVAKWRLKRERKRLSVYDNVAENDTGLSNSSSSHQEVSHPTSSSHHAQHHLKSEANDLKNEVGSRSSYASSYASSNERDEGFESASGTLSQRTSMSSTLEAEIYGTPTLSRRAENMKVKSAVDSPLSVEKPVISQTSANNAVIARLSEEASRKERTESWTEQTMRVSTNINGSKDTNSDTSTEFSALSPDSGHSTSKEDIWSDEASAAASTSTTSSPLKQKTSGTAPSRKLSTSSSKSGTSGEKTGAGKTVPSYMRPTSASVSARDSPSRTSVKESQLPPTIKRDSGVRASMRAETATASFQRGTVSRTSVRGPRSSIRLSAGRATTPTAPTSTNNSTTGSRSDVRPSSSLGRPRADSNVSVSSNASSTSNASSSLATTKRRLSHTSSAGTAASIQRPTTPSLRPTTPSAGRSTTPTARSSAPASVRSPAISSPAKNPPSYSNTLSPPASSSTKTPSSARSTLSPTPAQTTGSGGLKRTQSMRVTSPRPSLTAETASSVARRQAAAATPDTRRSTTPSHDTRRSTTPLSHEASRSTTPLSHERPRSTTPMDGRTTPRRSSFMAPTAASKARVDEQTPSAPPRTRSITTTASGGLTRHASLRLPKKSSPSTLTSKDIAGSGRKSPAALESPLHHKEHHQSLSTVTEQAADEDKEEQNSKKSPSLLKRMGITKSKVSPGAAVNTKILKTSSSVDAKKK